MVTRAPRKNLLARKSAGAPRLPEPECVLDAYLCHGKISPRAFRAGQRFYKEYARGILGIRVTASGSGSHGDREIGMLCTIQSKKLLRRAAAGLKATPIRLIITVCVDDCFAGSADKVMLLEESLIALADLWEIT